MSDTYISGSSISGGYAFEDPKAFNQIVTNHLPSDEDYLAFGRGVNISVARNHNKSREYSLGNRNAEASVNQAFVGSVTVDGILSSPYWFLGILGSVADGTSGEKFTHTYTEANRQPTLTIKRNANFGNTEGTEILVGGVINTASLTLSLNEPVRFNLAIDYRYEEDPDEETALVNYIDTEEIFTFAGASIEMPNGSELIGIENMEITINNSSKLEGGLSSRYAEAVSSGNREYNFSYTAKIKDYSMLKRFLAGDEIATLRVNLENQAGDTLVLNFTEVHINEDNLPTNPNETVKEEASGWAHNCTNAVYTNTQENAPIEATNISSL
jgi:hypothetical protein